MRSYIFVERLGFLTYTGCHSYFGDLGGSQVNFLEEVLLLIQKKKNFWKFELTRGELQVQTIHGHFVYNMHQ